MAVDLLVLSAVFMSISVASIAIRLYTRIVVLKNVGVDDCTLKVTWIIFSGLTFAKIWSVLVQYVSAALFARFVLTWPQVFTFVCSSTPIAGKFSSTLQQTHHEFEQIQLYNTDWAVPSENRNQNTSLRTKRYNFPHFAFLYLLTVPS